MESAGKTETPQTTDESGQVCGPEGCAVPGVKGLGEKSDFASHSDSAPAFAAFKKLKKPAQPG